MAHRREAGQHATDHALRRRVGAQQFGMRGLDRLQLLEQLVVLGVRQSPARRARSSDGRDDCSCVAQLGRTRCRVDRCPLGRHAGLPTGTSAAPPPIRRPGRATRGRGRACSAPRRSTSKCCSVSGRPWSSTALASMSSTSALMAWCQVANGSTSCGVCATSSTRLSSRTAPKPGRRPARPGRRRSAPAPAAPLPPPRAAPAGRPSRRPRNHGARRTAGYSRPTRPPSWRAACTDSCGVVRTGEGIEFACARHHVEHVGKVGHRADGVGNRLQLLHELGILDLVECPAAVGQLHAGLQFAIALAQRQGSHSPLAAFRPSIWNGLPPARREAGRCASSISPLTGASSVSVAIASIKASIRAPLRRAAPGNVGAAEPDAAGSTPSDGSTRSAAPVVGPASGTARRGRARRMLHRPCPASTPSSTTASRISAVVRLTAAAPCRVGTSDAVQPFRPPRPM